ncbi:MAG: FecR domain-containing protein [Bdellovibrionales bacterium]|nr:FecR domain-containing protein [Bdellovibrionales bacterium]
MLIWKKIIGWTAVVGPAIIAVIIDSSFAQSVQGAKVVGQIGLVSGTVLVDSARVRTGASVKVGSVIEVRGDSKATLILGKGSVFQIGSGSRMLVGEYGITPDREEMANLDLKFGKTRALILNQGPKRELKIRTRAATMGVRGTEVFVDSPKDSTKPVQFMTIEGIADVTLGEASAPIPLPQNQALKTEGVGGAQGGPQESPRSITPNEIKSVLNEGGLPPPPPVSGSVGGGPTSPPPPPGASRGMIGGLSDGFSLGPNVPVNLDPLQDRIYRPVVIPQFCNANSGICP